ncbi:hypothetical protein TNCT_457871 [Trichonephila clavata]|uniref:Uncharacterized protein n=1 Tax=Trichonephila clavata TaxID=2740835 RepID=A0A8X6K677_TRICU|nr:hypothetical protein TNCT_457871 [Trichonephila clavata]
MNEDSLISIFDNEEDKCSAPGCDFSNELPSPIFPDKTYQRTRKNLKNKVIEKELKLDERKYSVEQNQAYINSRKSNVRKKPKGSKISDAKKLTHGLKSSIQKIAPKSSGVEKGY